MPDWSKPDLDSFEIDVLSEIKARDDSLAKMFFNTVDVDHPIDSIQYNWNTGVFNRWTGAVWTPTIISVTGGGTGANNDVQARVNLGVNNASNLSTGTLGRARLPSATLSEQGAVVLNDSINSNSTTQAATANAVRRVNERIDELFEALEQLQQP